MAEINIIPLRVCNEVRPGDKIDSMIADSLLQSRQALADGDIVIVTQKIVSKAEGRIVELEKVKPSRKAVRMANDHGKDPRIVEVILRESKKVLRASGGVIVVETRHGFVCANAGVDQSNIGGDDLALLLPLDPDKSAATIKNTLESRTGKKVAVIITDTFGRPFRNGQVNVAIGVAGISPIKSYVGTADMHGKKLRVTEIAIADELASAAELVMGKIDSVPVAIIRGYKFKYVRKCSAIELVRPEQKDLFR